MISHKYFMKPKQFHTNLMKRNTEMTLTITPNNGFYNSNTVG